MEKSKRMLAGIIVASVFVMLGLTGVAQPVPVARPVFYYNKVDKGGHFAAWEQPQLLTEELRAAFKSPLISDLLFYPPYLYITSTNSSIAFAVPLK